MKIGILEIGIELGNWNFEELFKNRIFFKRIEFENWNFEKLF